MSYIEQNPAEQVLVPSLILNAHHIQTQKQIKNQKSNQQSKIKNQTNNQNLFVIVVIVVVCCRLLLSSFLWSIVLKLQKERVLEGYLKKKSPKGFLAKPWQARYFVLYDDVLQYFKKKGDTNPAGLCDHAVLVGSWIF